MVLEILMFGYGGMAVVFFLGYCAGGSWTAKGPHYLEEDLKHPPVETLKEMEL